VMAGGRGDDCVNGGAGTDYSIQYLYTQPNGNDDSHSLMFRYDY
jgi:hypothetical protein